MYAKVTSGLKKEAELITQKVRRQRWGGIRARQDIFSRKQKNDFKLRNSA
jgi:hypothetical protein